MSEFFAEATVQLRPDLTGFITKLRSDLKAAVGAVEGTNAAKVRIAPALTKNFIGDLRRQVDAATLRAQRGLKPIRIKAVISDVSLSGVARQAQLGGGIAPQIPLGGAVVGSAAADVRLSVEQVTRLNEAFRTGSEELGVHTAALNKVTSAREREAAAGAKSVQQRVIESKAINTLARAEERLIAAQLASSGSVERRRFLGEAASLATLGVAQAAPDERATAESLARGLRGQVEALSTTEEKLRRQVLDTNRAHREQQKELAKSARGHEQLRRGAFATGLSFLGIRGATLAASASFLIGAASFAVLARAIQSSAEFADQINVFRATAGATAEELERVRASARALGADISLPGVTATDAATAMVELAKAGLDVQQSIDGARGVLQLATAAAISNEQAVELAANALNAFGLQGRDATRVADTFANAANAAQGSIVDIGTAFQQAAAAGRQVGLSFEDTTTFLTILQREGVRGSDAGTSLRTALIRLIRPTEAARDRLRQLGIEVRDASGNLRPDIFQQISGALKDLPPAARDATIALIGGQDAFRAISILGRQSIDEFINLRRELRQQGTAGELAAARMEGLRGSVEGLGNTLSTAGVRIGQGLTPALQSVVVGVTSGAVAMSESEQVARTFASTMEAVEFSLSALGTTLTLIGPPLLTVASAFEHTANAVGVPTILAAVAAYKLFPPVFLRIRIAAAATVATLTTLAAVGPALTLRAAFTRLAGAINPVTVAAVAAGAAFVFLATRESQAERTTRRLRESTDALATSLAQARQAQRQAGELELGLNTAQLSVLEARQAVNTTRVALANSNAGRGSFERRKLELELAVALDNVVIAQERYRQAIEDSADARAEASQAARKATADQLDLIENLRTLARVERSNIPRRDLPQFSQAERQQRALRNITDAIREQARESREAGDADSIRLARRLDLLARVSTELNRIPTERSFAIAIEADSLRDAARQLITEFGVTGTSARAALLKELTRDPGEIFRRMAASLQGDIIRLRMLSIGLDGGDAFVRGVANGIERGSEQVETAVRNVMDRARAQIAGIERERLDLEIGGAGDAALLANLQQQAAVERGILERARAEQRAGRASFEPVRDAQENLAQTLSQIRAIQDQMAADVEAAAEDAKRKREEQDQNFLDLLGLGRERAQERIQDAQLTEGLADDIRFTIKLRRLVQSQIARVEEQIRTASIRIQATRELRAINRDLGRELKRLQQENQEQLRERAAERNQLDIEFAQINENRTAEIRARQREIARLKKLQDDTKRGTLEYRRLRNLIAEQQRAIKELKDQQKEKNNALRQLTFEFLQTQQGFAANLLGNLIPAGAIGGTVGGGSGGNIAGSRAGVSGAEGFGGGLGEALVQQGAATAAAGAGPTRGQATVEIDLLRQILGTLREIRGGRDHPEASRQHIATGGSMDIL